MSDKCGLWYTADAMEELEGSAAIAAGEDPIPCYSCGKWGDVPSDLWQAMYHLDGVCDRETKKAVFEYKPSAVSIKFKNDVELEPHFMCGVIGGMGMRNGWGLWQDSPLALWFRERGIWMADDMSGIIATAYWRWLHFLPVDEEWLQSERKWYDAYWAASGVVPETTEEMLERLADRR